MDVKPNYCSIETVFSENTLYKVPKFQRAYSWKANNVDQYTADLKSLYKNIKKGENEDSHFFGGIVCVKQKNTNMLDDKTIYQLVDGQQRLSTTVLFVSRLIIFLKTLRLDGELSGLREKRIKKYKNKYLELKTEENGKDVVFPKIELSRRDRLFYEKYVIKGETIEPIIESHRLIKNASLRIDKWIATFFKDLDNDTILKESDILFKVLSSACRILMIKMSNVSDAYRLFQVINDRGRSLTAGDLLRAASLGEFDAIEGRDENDLLELENCWDRITNQDSTSTNNKLIAYYTSKNAKTCSQTALFEEFNKAFFSNPDIIKDNILDIDASFKLYNSLHEGVWPYENSKLTNYQKKKLENITVQFKHTLCLPLLMAATKLKEKKFYQLVFFLEKFFFMFKVALDKRMTPVTKLYYSTIAAINNNPESYQVKNFINGLKEIVVNKVNKDEFATYLSNLQYVENGDNRSIKFLLSCIEENWKWLCSKNLGAAMMYKNAFKGMVDNNFVYTIEHIYPRNAKAANIDGKLELVKNNLGNLCLLYDQDNSAVKNDKFKDKKKFYATSRLNSTLELKDYHDFTEQEYFERATLIKERLMKVFL
ncbi:DUF262 domain-containing protein [Pseudoalteromonas xiamenensis]|uniref:DUF262 domain-containing protein n=1 Tax=Pseudoalteromonas xiamenensis TaxID=882626 RepID=UPI0035EFB186